jgi:transketolase
MGAAPMAYILWIRFLKHNPRNPSWPDRDRFVLSAGHGSALLYALLHLTGYPLSIEEIKRFRQWGSKTPGHPEYGETPGVESTTGPLGQGLANAVGMAIAERHLASQFNRPGFEIVDHKTFALVSDGDLMEGVAAEAASLAGHLGLGKLICLYDDNAMTLGGATPLTFTEKVSGRFEAYGWHFQTVADGNDVTAIARAIAAAQGETARPSLIAVRTHIGYGSPHKQDTFEVHGSPLGPEEVAATKKNMGWPLEPRFHIPREAAAQLGRARVRGQQLEDEWRAKLDSYGKTYPDLSGQWDQWTNSHLPEGWDKDIPVFPPDPQGTATRSAGGKVMNAIAARLPWLMGGSADLNPSTNTPLKGLGNFQNPRPEERPVPGSETGPWGYKGANLFFGVREHAMGSILNGMALHGGVLPYGSTFLVFSDYMRPSIRLAALMKLHLIYVFTHDSIALGEDGPTHQPIEHLAGLRAIPGLTVIRPADANEAAEAWRTAILHKEGPVALIMTRQAIPILDRNRFPAAKELKRGAYILAQSSADLPDLILMATGSEVHLGLEAYERLSAEGRRVRLVNLPSWELFQKQPEEYRRQILPPAVPFRISIEAGATHGWHKYVGSSGEAMGIDRFGASAPGKVLLEKFGFTPENIVKKAKELLSRP